MKTIEFTENKFRKEYLRDNVIFPVNGIDEHKIYTQFISKLVANNSPSLDTIQSMGINLRQLSTILDLVGEEFTKYINEFDDLTNIEESYNQKDIYLRYLKKHNLSKSQFSQEKFESEILKLV